MGPVSLRNRHGGRNCEQLRLEAEQLILAPRNEEDEALARLNIWVEPSAVADELAGREHLRRFLENVGRVSADRVGGKSPKQPLHLRRRRPPLAPNDARAG